MTQALVLAALGTGFTFGMTALGACVVFLFRRQSSPGLHRVMLGFAAGVMLAASVWSLLIPSIEKARELHLAGWLPAAGGSALGIAFLLAMDALLPHLAPESFHWREGQTSRRRTLMLVLAVTLHNIPEGMAVGVSFALAAQAEDPALLTAAVALALGIGVQNFPEGAAIALPLRQEGMSRRRAFALGALSGVVEPVFGLPVGEVSKALGRGRHTTRHVEMFPLDEDTYVIDTPGFSSFDTEELDLELKARLPETFPEFAPYLGQCRFVGCSHVKEKGCAVLQAVKDGRIPASRHRSYVRLYDELKELRDWQHK